MLCTLIAASGLAATKRGQVGVKVSVAATCTIEGGVLDFGPYTAGQTRNLDASGSLRLLGCTQPVTIAVDGGRGGSISNRAMRSSSGGRLRYQLYRFSTRDTVWGTDSSARKLKPLGREQAIPVYGRIPSGQKVPAGTYTDVVQVTMTF